MRNLKNYLFLLPILLFACHSDMLIPQKDMVQILVKISLIDATIITTDSRNTLYYKDTIDYYSSAYEAMGYTKAQFDSSISYYSRNPKEFDLLFDKVIIELSKMETKLTEETNQANSLKDSTAIDTAANLWNQKTLWSIPEDGIDNHIYFNIPVKGFGTYTLSGDFQVFEDDKSVKPRVIAYFYYDDKSESGKLTQAKEHVFQQDGISRKVSLSFELNDPKVTHLKGVLLDNGNDNGKVKKHVLISNLMVKYKPFPSNQNTIPKTPKMPHIKENLKPE